jgi:hypothetical protein
VGGYGSGRWGWSHAKKDTVEECRSIDVGSLRREGQLRRGHVWSGRMWWSDSSGQEIASLGMAVCDSSVRLNYTLHWKYQGRPPDHIDYTVPVVWTPCHFGGERPWFLCPGRGCGRRVAKLYMAPGVAKYYLCRHCHDLTYKSRQQWNKQVAALRKDPEALTELLRELNNGEPTLERSRLLLRAIEAKWGGL